MIDEQELPRFCARFTVCPETGCWLWILRPDSSGYGVFTYRGLLRKAHRVSYELFVGPIPAGLQMDHLCRVRHCCNPDHLEAVTQLENVRRGNGHIGRREQQLAKTHCVAGHEFDYENTYRNPRTGIRTCRACRAARMRRYAAA